MRVKGIRPALVLCSPARRTRETLEAIKPALGKACSIEFVPGLYAASDRHLLEQLHAVPDSISAVMLIGHNPGLQRLARLLASSGTDLAKLEEKFPTAALAALTVESDGWAGLRPGAAELVDYVVPRDLD
jgi:phosphohistidine phosphatase